MINDEEYEGLEDRDDYVLYTEIATNLIYDVRFFDEFVIIRPASPAFWSAIIKMNMTDFAREFREFYGDPAVIIAALAGEEGITTLLN